MLKNKVAKVLIVVVLFTLVAGAGTVLYLYYLPKRDVQAQDADHQLDASSLVAEYMADAATANAKYLDEEGESNVLVVKGQVSQVTKDIDGNIVALLKRPSDKAGVSCTFLPGSLQDPSELKQGQEVLIKGVIRSGASYDEDLELYEDVILEDCAIVSKD